MMLEQEQPQITKLLFYSFDVLTETLNTVIKSLKGIPLTALSNSGFLSRQ